MTLQVGHPVKLNTSLCTNIAVDGEDHTLRGTLMQFNSMSGRRQIVLVRWNRRIRYPQNDECSMLHYMDTLIPDVDPDSLQGRVQTYITKELG